MGGGIRSSVTGTQCAAILTMLKRGPITPLDAIREAKCMRLAARIADLKAEGHNITMEMVTQGEKRFAKYSLMRQHNG